MYLKLVAHLLIVHSRVCESETSAVFEQSRDITHLRLNYSYQDWICKRSLLYFMTTSYTYLVQTFRQELIMKEK
jgi:hypothetical protein